MAIKESVIQKSILDYLELYSRSNPCYFFRAGAGAMKLANGRFFKTGKPGCPDIVLCLSCPIKSGGSVGVFVGLEVKNEKGRQSQSQKVAESEIQDAGGFYYLVRSISDVKEAMKDVDSLVWNL